ncbi:MAG: hypothetical protein AAGC95_16735, partial [Pseudomonadota bacterium]
MSGFTRIIFIISLLLNAVFIGGAALSFGYISNVVDLINTSLSKMSERRIDAFEASKIDAVDVVFLGDSITHEGMWS